MVGVRQQFVDRLKLEPTEVNRLVFADWLEENNEIDLACALRGGMVAVEPVVEIDMAELMDSYDWAEVFADESSGNTDKTTDACPPGSDVDCTPPSRADVAEIIAAVNGKNDSDSWTGVFRLKDGRFLLADGGCDYTGWD